VPQPSYRLLAVDDEPLALNLINRVFESESDIEVISTTSAVRGVEMAMLSDIDLVITDQRMPEMEGLQLLARIREIRPRALRILLTAFPDTTVALTAINEGLVYKFVLKPWEPEDMRVTIRRALETKRLADEHEKLVNQLKTSRDELVRAEHMAALGRLSAGIGHELGHAVQALLAAVGQLETEVRRVVGAAQASEQALARNFVAADVARMKSEILRAAPEILGGTEQTLVSVRAATDQLQALIQGMKEYASQGQAEPTDINQAALAKEQPEIVTAIEKFLSTGEVSTK